MYILCKHRDTLPRQIPCLCKLTWPIKLILILRCRRKRPAVLLTVALGILMLIHRRWWGAEQPSKQWQWSQKVWPAVSQALKGMSGRAPAPTRRLLLQHPEARLQGGAPGGDGERGQDGGQERRYEQREERGRESNKWKWRLGVKRRKRVEGERRTREGNQSNEEGERGWIRY